MGRSMRTSKIMEKASARAAGLRSIGTLDFGNGLTSTAFEAAITDTREKLEAYNESIALSNEKANVLDESEKTLRDLHERILAGVAAKYGKNSNEYGKAGGKRKADRKRPGPRKPGSGSDT